MESPKLIPLSFLEQAAKRFRLLGEPVRLALLNRIHAHGELNVQELVDATGQSHANVSKHLRLMADEGLVAARREGRYAYYRILDPTISALCMLVCGELRRQADLTREDAPAAH